MPLVAGAAGGAMIARAWYPRDDGPGRDAARFAAMTVVGQAGANVFKEFAPELKRLIPRRALSARSIARQRDRTPAPPSSRTSHAVRSALMPAGAVISCPAPP